MPPCDDTVLDIELLANEPDTASESDFGLEPQYPRPAPPESRGILVPPWCRPEDLVYSFTLPMSTPSNNVIKGMHWMTYRNLRRTWRLKVLTRGLGGKKPAEPIERAALLVLRHSSGKLDWDNALGGLKPLLDCLVVRKAKVNPDGLGLIVDDNPDNMPFPPYMQQLPAPPENGLTEVFIYRLPDAMG
jgi:hypothetical protein